MSFGRRSPISDVVPGGAQMRDVIDGAADGARAEQHVAVAGVDAGVAGAVAEPRPDDEVVEAVAVDVAGRGDRNAGLIGRVLAMDDEAAVAGRDGGEVDRGAEAAGLAEHHVAVAGKVARVARARAGECPDDEVVEAVAVDVARRGDRAAGLVVRVLAMDDEAAVAGGDRGEVDRAAKPPAWPNTT